MPNRRTESRPQRGGLYDYPPGYRPRSINVFEPRIPGHSTKPAAPAREELREFPHGLHFVLTVCTGGLWLPVWLIAGLPHRKTNQRGRKTRRR